MREKLIGATTFMLRFELPVVALVTLASMASSSLLRLAVVVIVFFWAVRALNSFLCIRRIVSAKTPADLAIIVLCAMLPVTLWATPNIETTLPQVLRLITGVGLFFAITNWRMPVLGHSVHSIPAFVFTAIGVALTLSIPFTVEAASPKLSFIPASLYQSFRLLVADGINPNVMAGALALLLPVAFAQILASQRSRLPGSAFFILASALIMAGVLVTGSRSAILAVSIAALLILFLRWPRGVLVLLIAGVAAAGIGIIATGGKLEAAVATALNSLTTSEDALSGSTTRVEIWSRAIYITQDFPFTGIGMGMFPVVTDLLYPMIFTRTGVEHAHNLLLQIAVDLGLPGLVAWMAIFAVVIVCLVQQLRSRNTNFPPMIVGLLGAQVALITGGITDAVTWGMVRSAPLVWAIWGVAVASWLSFKRQTQAQ